MTIARNDHLFAEKLAAKRRVSALERRIVSREHAATTCRFMQTQIADILAKLEPQDARADQMDPAVVDSVKALRQSFVSLVQDLDMYGTVPDFKNADNIRKIATKSSSIPKPKPVTKKVIEAMIERRGKNGRPKADLHMQNLSADIKKRLRHDTDAIAEMQEGFDSILAKYGFEAQLSQPDDVRFYIEDYRDARKKFPERTSVYSYGYASAIFIARARSLIR